MSASSEKVPVETDSECASTGRAPVELAVEIGPVPPPAYSSEYTTSPTTVTSISPISSTMLSDIERYPQSVSEVTMSTVIPAREYVMRDEERYPTVVIHSAPELYSPLESVAISQPPVPDQSPLAPSGKGMGSFANEIPTATRRKICWIPRKTFFLTVPAILLLVIGLSVGLGVWASSRSGNKKSSFPMITSSGTWTNSNKSTWYSQVYGTNRTTGKMMLSLSDESGKYRPAEPMNLTIQPPSNTPMAAVAKLGNDSVIYLSLFYIKDQEIITANVSCVPMICTLVSNEPIRGNLTFPIAGDSGLGVVYQAKSDSYHVFYQNKDRYITQLTNDDDGNWDHGRIISAGKSLAGSKIAVANIGTTGDMHLLYVDASTKMLFQVYNQQKSWRNPAPVSTSPFPQWDPSTSFTSTYVPALDSLRAYFVGSDRLIYELQGKNASSPTFAAIARGDLQPNETSGISSPGWKQELYHDLTWFESDTASCGITSSSWNDQIRFYRVIKNHLAVATFRDGVWSAKWV
ncbi:hypothetical protein HYFRA_00008703 [Hymenoscyphus fraxineus]|uniref:Fucose-specific lectin n=1 Tax=Hymenoscyphus fraxineus TaxID=746836 RepID=A0A9N9KWW6_9HELO|nr:hypothetical protein HYFRA_00008703 [Hymenoscyphus fraxineus]